MDIGLARILFRLMTPYRWAIPALVILGVLSSLFEGVGIGLLIPLAREILGQTEATEGLLPDVLEHYAAAFDDDQRALFIALSIFGLILAKCSVQYGNHVLAAWVNGRISDRLRSAAFSRLVSLELAGFRRLDEGRLVNTVTGETWRATEAFQCGFALLVHLCTVATFLVILLLISWELTLFVIAGTALVSLVVRILVRHAQRLGEHVVAASATISERVVSAVSGMRTIRAFGREAFEQEKLDAASERMRASMLRMEQLSGAIQPLTEVLYLPLFFGALLLALHGGVGLASLLAFLVLLYRMIPHAKAVEHARVSIARYKGSVQEVTRFLDASDGPPVQSGTVSFRGLRRSITFEHVAFRYDAQAALPLIEDVAFQINKGQVTGIVGSSGAGKTTLINLLYRFYDPTAGEIRVDGLPLRHLDLASWRKRLAIAGQDAEILSGSILDNIRYGAPDAPLDAVIAAASEAGAHDFIAALPSDYDTQVGGRALRLSGGQRQRIALARALLRDPDLLILDEATNALDTNAEQFVQEALARLRGRRTILVVAHRLGSLRHADWLIVLEAGRVLEAGAPGDLLNANGAFARLYRLQAAELTRLAV